MDEISSLLEEFRSKCDLGAQVKKKLQDDLLGFIGEEEVHKYYVTLGPLPRFPSTDLDIIILTANCLLDFEIQKGKSLCHVYFLNQIVSMSEVSTGTDDEDYLSLEFRTGALFGITLQDKQVRAKQIREFANAVRNNVLKYYAK